MSPLATGFEWYRCGDRRTIRWNCCRRHDHNSFFIGLGRDYASRRTSSVYVPPNPAYTLPLLRGAPRTGPSTVPFLTWTYGPTNIYQWRRPEWECRRWSYSRYLRLSPWSPSTTSCSRSGNLGPPVLIRRGALLVRVFGIPDRNEDRCSGTTRTRVVLPVSGKLQREVGGLHLTQRPRR